MMRKFGTQKCGLFPAAGLLLLLIAHNCNGLLNGNLAALSATPNPCTYPSPTRANFNKICQITDPSLQRYNICDPYSAVSMTEVDVVVKHLDALNLKKSRGEYCLCNTMEGPCWYRFAFAFITTLDTPDFYIPRTISLRKLCSSSNMTRFISKSHHDNSGYQTTVIRQHTDPTDIVNYGNTFARLLRKQWDYAKCGEDILLLVVKHRPPELSARRDGRLFPMVFMSYGRTVQRRTRHITTTKKQTMEHVLLSSNKKLDNGYSLKAILESVIDNYELLLTIADQTYKNPQSKSHIPGWALASFAACAVLLAIMGAGLCLLRTGVRRGAVHKPNGGDGGRRWKAGFVGDAYDAQRGHFEYLLKSNNKNDTNFAGMTQFISSSVMAALPQTQGHRH